MRSPDKPVKPGDRASRILIVDDSDTMRLYVRTILTSLGYRVWEAPDGAEAFDYLLANEIDLVITDLEMTPMSGFELMAAISLLPSWRRPKTIVLSSLAEDARQRTELRQAAQVLAKPVNLHVLATAVRDALEDRRESGASRA